MYVVIVSHVHCIFVLMSISPTLSHVWLSVVKIGPALKPPQLAMSLVDISLSIT